MPALLSGVIEEQGFRQHQVVLGCYCWKLRPVDDDGRARESRAPLHPIYKVRQLFVGEVFNVVDVAKNSLARLRYSKEQLSSGKA